MLLPDLILLAVVLALAAWRLFAPSWRPTLRVAAVAVGFLLAAAQWALCDYTWQDLPAYLLLALSALPPLPTGGVLRWSGRLGLALLATAALGVWILPAVPTLPQPDGRYAVATQVYRWTDATRDEPQTADPTDRRSVIAQAWYPTTRREQSRGVSRIAYIDGIGHMPSQVSVMPGFMLRRYGQIDTHAEALAPLAPGDRPWPVVIFSPGYGAPRAVYTGLATRLASRGFVIFVLDHPYESAVTQLPDGRVVGTREMLLPGERDRTSYMARQQVVRVADVRFVVNQLAHADALSPLRGRIDASKVAVIGHSFGGAASIAAMTEDPRVVAAANIDGTPYGDLPDRTLTRPFLLLQSDQAETHHGDRFNTGNGKLLTAMEAPGFRYEIKRANHYSFTDAPFFVAPPGRWLLAQAIGGGRGPAATHQAAADILAAFLTGPLTGAASDLAATAARYPEVLGGAVEHKPAGGRRAGSAAGHQQADGPIIEDDEQRVGRRAHPEPDARRVLPQEGDVVAADRDAGRTRERVAVGRGLEVVEAKLGGIGRRQVVPDRPGLVRRQRRGRPDGRPPQLQFDRESAVGDEGAAIGGGEFDRVRPLRDRRHIRVEASLGGKRGRQQEGHCGDCGTHEHGRSTAGEPTGQCG
jgi:predicted dienelactone hydrolase